MWAVIDTSVYTGHWERGSYADTLAEVRKAFVIRHSAVVLSELRRGARTRDAAKTIARLHDLAPDIWEPTDSICNGCGRRWRSWTVGGYPQDTEERFEDVTGKPEYERFFAMDRTTDLSLAAQSGDHGRLLALLDAGTDIEERSHVWDPPPALERKPLIPEGTPLMAAVYFAREECVGLLVLVRLLLGSGRPPGPGGQDALVAAVDNGDKATIELLLGHGVDVNGRGILGRLGPSALMAAVRDFSVCGDPGTPLRQASDRRRDMAEFLLAKGADVHDRDASENTVLMLAAWGKDAAEVVALLIGGPT